MVLILSSGVVLTREEREKIVSKVVVLNTIKAVVDKAQAQLALVEEVERRATNVKLAHTRQLLSAPRGTAKTRATKW